MATSRQHALSTQLLQRSVWIFLIPFFSFPEAEETLLIDIATNSKFHNCSHAAKAPFGNRAAC